MSDSKHMDAAAAAREEPSTVYSGIRYSANEIENLALQAYWVNPAKWDEIQKCLQAATRCLYLLTLVAGKDDCPWTTCDNGKCSPVCPEDP